MLLGNFTRKLLSGSMFFADPAGTSSASRACAAWAARTRCAPRARCAGRASPTASAAGRRHGTWRCATRRCTRAGASSSWAPACTGCRCRGGPGGGTCWPGGPWEGTGVARSAHKCWSLLHDLFQVPRRVFRRRPPPLDPTAAILLPALPHHQHYQPTATGKNYFFF